MWQSSVTELLSTRLSWPMATEWDNYGDELKHDKTTHRCWLRAVPGGSPVPRGHCDGATTVLLRQPAIQLKQPSGTPDRRSRRLPAVRRADSPEGTDKLPARQ
ncbi:hypothetical protein BaRGS_00028321 [Batillaria attramentaria]|uniref:Uncharacterized protein n=1 Tax=Batillaria attramentaria TaxID=370345 RepID=A0ABD0K013_9CAEN